MGPGERIRGGWALAPAALVVGTATALGVWLFKRLIDGAVWLAHGWAAASWSEAPLLIVLLVPVVGGLVVGLLLHWTRVPEEPGHGVAEVIAAVTLGTEEFPERRTAPKTVGAALSLGAGASLGPEDPAVEIGGSLGHFISRKWGFPEDSIQALVAVGAAGGLAAAFHAPLAAVAFAVEVFALRLLSGTTGLVVAGAAVAHLVTLAVAPTADLALPSPTLPGGWLMAAAAVVLCAAVGAVAGAVSAGQIRLVYTLELAVVRWERVPRWVKPALGGVALGLAGAAAPQLLGIGYEPLEAVLAGDRPGVVLLLALALGKVVLVAVSFGSGFLGGFFAPSLVAGGLLGAGLAAAAAAAVPGDEGWGTLVALAGMAALLAGNVRAPVAAALLVAGLATSPVAVPVLLVATVAADRTSRALERHSLYTYGITHRTGKERERPGPGRPEHDIDGGLRRVEE